MLDIACGVGYGAKILADAGHTVVAGDIDEEALAYARLHFGHTNVAFIRADISAFTERDVVGKGFFDAATCFETIEHVADPRPFLKALAFPSGPRRLFASVPNDVVFPFTGQLFHHRHYTAPQLADLLLECGWHVVGWYGQEGPISEVSLGCHGRTIVVEAVTDPRFIADIPEHWKLPEPVPGRLPAPAQNPNANRRVAIVGLGPTIDAWTLAARVAGGRHAVADEVWAINAAGAVIQCDRIYHMDETVIQQIRAAARPQSNIANMLAWLKTHPGPIYTSIKHPGFPGFVEFPLEDVINNLGYKYFNSTAAYAVAHAIHEGFGTIQCWGLDFSYGRSTLAEQGRGGVEFWLGFAARAGINIVLPERTTLMDSITGAKLYGYESVDVNIEQQPDGRARVRFSPVERLPTAEEIEARYDHSRHPNEIVRAEIESKP